jgi:hypothetical protein
MELRRFTGDCCAIRYQHHGSWTFNRGDEVTVEKIEGRRIVFRFNAGQPDNGWAAWAKRVREAHRRFLFAVDAVGFEGLTEPI